MKLSKKFSIHVKMSDMKLLSFELVMGAVKSVVRGAADRRSHTKGSHLGSTCVKVC
jgi:hypothetical protein